MQTENLNTTKAISDPTASKTNSIKNASSSLSVGTKTASNDKHRDNKKSNTVIQQINTFSLTPMNDKIAEDTIDDHKYLLQEV